MGVDLRLLPVLGKGYWACHDMIDLDRDYDLWRDINALPSEAIPEPIWCFLSRDDGGDSKYGKAEEDPYGQKLRWVTAGSLASVEGSISFLSWKKKAAWAYLKEMPEDWPIVLYWH